MSEQTTKACPDCGEEMAEVTSRYDRAPRFQCDECGHEETVELRHDILYVTTVEDRENGIERYLCQRCPGTWTKPRGEPSGECPRTAPEKHSSDA